MLNNNSYIKLAHQVFDDEIATLNAGKLKLNDNFQTAVELITDCKGKVITSGIGKSGHIASKIASTFSSTGTESCFLHPSEALHGDLGLVNKNDVILAISYSGETEELLSVLQAVYLRGVRCIAMTGNLESSITKFATAVLSIAVEKEACKLNLAPTSSTTLTLVIGDALAICVSSAKMFQAKDFANHHPGGNLGRKLFTKVTDVMHSGDRLPILNYNAGIADIVIEISKKALGIVAIIDDSNKLYGTVTDGDLRRAFSNWSLSLTGKDIANKTPKTIHYNELAITATKLMQNHKIHALIVLNDDNYVIGALNIHDLFIAKIL